MLMRTDPFAHLGRLTHQLLGINARPSAMPINAPPEVDPPMIEFDLPGVSADAVDRDVERNVLAGTAQWPEVDDAAEYLAAERPRGVCSWQLSGDLGPTGSTRLPGRRAPAGHPGHEEGHPEEDHQRFGR